MRPYLSESEDDDSSMSSAFSDEDELYDKNNTKSQFFAKLVRDTRSKVEQKTSELNATVQEKLPEWKQRGQIYSNKAKETGMEWSRRGKEAVDRWKKERAAAEGMPSSSRQLYNNNNQQENAVFGMPLEVAVALTKIDQDDLTPAVFRRCIDYLDEYGIHEVGIYRIPGSTITVNKLRAVFNDGNDIDFHDTTPDPHAVGTLLKMYLRELPEPIVPFELANEYTEQFMDSIQSINDSAKKQAMQDTIISNNINTNNVQLPPISPSLLRTVRSITTRLPIYNFCLLQLLCRHLQRVVSFEQENRMNVSNLAVIFIPTLNIGRALFHCMVENYFDIFEKKSSTTTTTATNPSSSSSTSSAGPKIMTNGAPPPLPQKPRKLMLEQSYQTSSPSSSPIIKHTISSTSSDPELLQQQKKKKMPPPKPSRSPVPPPKPAKKIHSRQKSEYSTNTMKKPPPPPVKPRSKSISSFRDPPTTTGGGSRVEAIGRQFENLMKDGALKNMNNNNNKNPNDR